MSTELVLLTTSFGEPLFKSSSMLLIPPKERNVEMLFPAENRVWETLVIGMTNVKIQNARDQVPEIFLITLESGDN